MIRDFLTGRAFVSTDSEYQANLAGLNMFFGAVLGFVITGIEKLDAVHFTVMLGMCSAIVMCILYVSASRNRWFWVAIALLFILGIPRLLPDGVAPPEKLQPTLLVWLLLTLIIELAPRRRDEEPRAEA